MPTRIFFSSDCLFDLPMKFFVYTWFEVRFASIVTPLESGQPEGLLSEKRYLQSENEIL